MAPSPHKCLLMQYLFFVVIGKERAYARNPRRVFVDGFWFDPENRCLKDGLMNCNAYWYDFKIVSIIESEYFKEF